MKREVAYALDDCLALLEQGEITPEECLRRYPEYADELRPLLIIALETRRTSLPSPSTTALETWERQMFAALDKRKQRQPVPLQSLRSLFSPRRLAYAAALVVAGIIVGAFLYFGGRTTTVYAATLTDVSGSVQVLPADSTTWRSASTGQKVGVGDRVYVDSSSAAALSFPGGCSTDLRANTDIDILEMDINPDKGRSTIVLYQRLGETRHCLPHSTGHDLRFEVRTPAASVIAHETEFTVTVRDDGVTNVAVVEGTVGVTAEALDVLLQAGQATSVEPARPPAPVHTTPAPTEEPTVTVEAEEPEGHVPPVSGAPQGTKEPEPPEPAEPQEPESEETEGHNVHQEPEPPEPQEPEEDEEADGHEAPVPDEPGGPENPKERLAKPPTSGETDELEEHGTPAPGESHETGEPGSPASLRPLKSDEAETRRGTQTTERPRDA